jgi:TonB dependent receptor-like, beta-barrel/Carboxypeptidase regulatory-like domain/TonB-dependent Receptor Plug Domain
MVGRVVRAVLCALLVSAGCVHEARAQAEQAQAAPGTITGVVLDKRTGDPIVDAGVEVVGQGVSTRTDLDGKYAIKVGAGTYDVRVFAAGMQGVRLQGVLVKAGQTSTADAVLESSAQAGLVVEVVAPAKKATEEAQILQRKAAPTVSETISAETMRKSGGSDAAAIVRRAPGLTVRDDKFVYVRGLGERYTQALLDGSRLPSTDPQRRVVPLDIFPASFLNSLNIIKTFTPNLPGDFSGGLIDLNLREFPPEFEASLSSSIGGNTQATLRDFQTYRSTSLDYLGMGVGFRSFPAGMTGGDPLQTLGPRGNFRLARQFRDIWNTDSIDAPLNTGLGFTLGNSKGPLGFQIGARYSAEYKRYRDVIERQFEPPKTQGGGGGIPSGENDFTVLSDFRRNYSIFEVKLGGIITAGYKLNDDNNLTFRGFIQRNTFDNVQGGLGVPNVAGCPAPDNCFSQQQTIFRYTAEQLNFGQLAGEHRLPWASVNWRSALVLSTQDEPDTRFNIRDIGTTPNAPPSNLFSNDSFGGTRIFNTLRENLTDNALDVTVPYALPLPFQRLAELPGKFQFGPAFTFRTRHSAQRRFEFQRPGQLGAIDLSQPTQDVLDPSNIGAGGIQFIETTVPQDKFSATQEIIAGYGQFDMFLWPNTLRLVAGVRPQYSYIVVKTFGTETVNGTVTQVPVKPIINDFNPLPGVNLTYSPRSDMNVRVGWSRTVSYPEFRELSPVQYIAPRGDDSLQGNPDLISSKIESVDLRWEWFFSPLELVSLSFYHKKLQNPIERSVLAVGSGIVFSFFNAESATLTGMEFEFRKDFGFLSSLSSRFKNLSFMTNLNYSTSTAITPRGAFQVQTSQERQLQGQAPYILNVSLDYNDPSWGSARLLYNRIGSTLFAVSAYGIPDRFEEPRNQLDAVLIMPLERFTGVPITAQLGIENILNDRYLWKVGDETQRRFTKGVKFGLVLTYNFN